MNLKLKLHAITFFVVAVMLLVISGAPKFTAAHVLKIDGTIGGVIHINPDDDPIVGEAANIYFDIQDTINKFKGTNCDCTLIIKDASTGKTVDQRKKLDSISNDKTIGFIYTFKQKGIYTLILHGEGVPETAFSPFNLSYDIRVEREPSNSISTASVEAGTSKEKDFLSTHYLHLVGVGIVVLYTVYLLIKDSREKKHYTEKQ